MDGTLLPRARTFWRDLRSATEDASKLKNFALNGAREDEDKRWSSPPLTNPDSLALAGAGSWLLGFVPRYSSAASALGSAPTCSMTAGPFAALEPAGRTGLVFGAAAC